MSKNERIHGIDALRAVSMLLGIVLHAAIAYKTISIPTWPHDPDSSHWSFDFMYMYIHSFRMPLFFFIAGYFCRFLYLKIGEKDFIGHRFRRIVIPFLASLVIILPLTIFPFLYYNYSQIHPGNINQAFEDSFRQLFKWNGMAHLWFLYYLIIYYFAFLVLVRFRKLAFGQIKTRISLPLSSPAAMVFFSVLVASVLFLNMESLYLHVDTGIIPGLPYLLFFALFFGIGWIVNINPKPFFSSLISKTWYLLIAGTALLIFLYIKTSGKEINNNELIIYKLLTSIQLTCLIYGFIGFFLKYFPSGSHWWRYISDASYWMYLVHLMIIASLQILFLESEWPGIVKFALILIITSLVSLVSYHFLVRYSFIGDILHGKREKAEPEEPVSHPKILLKKSG